MQFLPCVAVVFSTGKYIRKRASYYFGDVIGSTISFISDDKRYLSDSSVLNAKNIPPASIEEVVKNIQNEIEEKCSELLSKQ